MVLAHLIKKVKIQYYFMDIKYRDRNIIFFFFTYSIRNQNSYTFEYDYKYVDLFYATLVFVNLR